MKTIKIAGALFEINEPYSEGHSITPAEAKALNQTRAENISNNARKKIEALADVTEVEGKKVYTFSPEGAAAAAKVVADLDAEYVFTMTNAGAGRKVVDPVEREAISIAKGRIALALKKAGRAIKDVDKEKLDAKVAALAATDEVRKIAAKRVREASNAATEVPLDDL